VDFFSVTFGLCGITTPGDNTCDFTPEVRQALGDWFRAESVTSTWIRATSPTCNCSHSWESPMDGTQSDVTAAHAKAVTAESTTGSTSDPGPYPAYKTCAAGRPDHGSNGAYPSWPAFALEALCYVDGNCSSACEHTGNLNSLPVISVETHLTACVWLCLQSRSWERLPRP